MLAEGVVDVLATDQSLLKPPLAARLPPMPDEVQDARPLSLLEELDARQDELLDELDRLNQRIERVIGEWTRQQPTTEEQPKKVAA
jgi:uncharacterized protein YdcH (DUF465 family)